MPFLSLIMARPIKPPTVGIIPIMMKNFFQSSTVASTLVKESKPPKTTAMANSGIMARTVSTFALFAVFVTSVIHVLNDASLLTEPITDIIQSMATTSITIGKTLSAEGCIGTSEKAAMVKPQTT